MFGVIVEVLIFTLLTLYLVGTFYAVFQNSIDANPRASLIWLVCIYLGCAVVALSVGSMLSH